MSNNTFINPVANKDGSCPSVIEISTTTPSNPGALVGDLAIDYTNGIIFRWNGHTWINILQGSTGTGNITGTITASNIPYADASDDLADTIYSYDNTTGSITAIDGSSNTVVIEPSQVSLNDNLGNQVIINTNSLTVEDNSGNAVIIDTSEIQLQDITGDVTEIKATEVKVIDSTGDYSLVTAGQVQVYTASNNATADLEGATIQITETGVSTVYLSASQYQMQIAQTGGQDFILKPNQSVVNGITVQAPPVTGVMAIQLTGKYTVTGGVGQTVFNIAHGAAFTPYYASVTPASAGASGAHWISALGAADITVTFAVSPGAVSVSFYFQVMP